MAYKQNLSLEAAGVPIIGTTPDSIDLAEDRERFQKLLNDLGLKQPVNGIAASDDEAIAIAERDGLHPNEMHVDRLRRGLARVEANEGA